jgi:hypothetical protein
MSMEYYIIENRTRYLPAFSAVPQTTAPPRALFNNTGQVQMLRK